MKCYLVDGCGIEAIKQVDRPEPRLLNERDVLVDVQACSLNYRDLMIAKGQYKYRSGQHEPNIALSDMSGVVKAVGSQVTEWQPGDRVLNSAFRHWPAGTLRSSWARTFIGAGGLDGVLAERIVYPADALVPVPPHLSFAEASTLPIAGLTAWAAVVTHGRARPGDWVLLQGTGGVSTFAAQIARGLGARTILTTSSDKKAERARKDLGVAATVNYREANWPEQVKKITQGQGVDVVVDVVGGDTLSQSLEICAYGARVAAIGILGGHETTLRIRDLLMHQVQIRGIMMESTEELHAFVRAVDALKIKPVIDKIFPFEKAKDAYRYLEAQQHIGKVVIAKNFFNT